MDYWKECISTALDDVELKTTQSQIEDIAESVEGAFENYGMAHGYDQISSPSETEADRLRKELKEEKDKITCKSCNGRGHDVSYGVQYESECSNCKGEGRHPR